MTAQCQTGENLMTTNIQGDDLFQAAGRSTGLLWSLQRPGALAWGSVPLSLISAGRHLTKSMIIWRNNFYFFIYLDVPNPQADKCSSGSCGGWTSHEPGISLCLFWATASSGLHHHSYHIVLHFFNLCLQCCSRCSFPTGSCSPWVAAQ